MIQLLRSLPPWETFFIIALAILILWGVVL